MKGVRFYNNLIDELVKHDIVPYVTLFHWDLPQALEDTCHGWLDDGNCTLDAFGEYARTAYSYFGDRVKHFITLNEPWT